MQVLFYSSDSNKTFDDLISQVKGIVENNKIFFFTRLDHFTLWLKRPGEKNIGSIAILHPKDEEELESILNVKHMLNELRLILILPDRNDETVSKGHKLRPRFLTFQDNDYKEVYAVIEKMSASTNPKKKAAA